jgi:hypothetical protein
MQEARIALERCSTLCEQILAALQTDCLSVPEAVSPRPPSHTSTKSTVGLSIY